MSPLSISILTGFLVILAGMAIVRPRLRKADWEYIVKPQLWQTKVTVKGQGSSFYDRHVRGVVSDYQPFFDKVKAWLNLDEAVIATKIYQAGSPWKAEEVVNLQVVAIVFGAALFLFSLLFVGDTAFELLGAFTALAGYVYPGSHLSDAAKRRRRQIQLALPDFLDLLVTLLEVGVAPQDAIHQVAESFQGATGEEFRKAAIASRYNGGNWSAALEEMADRLGVEEVSDLVSAMLIANEKGTPLAPVLRDQVARHRYKQQQDYEEKAARVGTKILPVMAVFILMPLLALLLAPAFSQFKGF